MNQTEPVNEFKKGLTALRKGYPSSAVVHLRKAVENDNGNPFYLSYYGLAVARAGHDWAKAEHSCLAALRMKRNHALLYVNLAEVYRRGGQIEYAVGTLYNGLPFTKWDLRLVRALEELGVRRPPVLPFLDRMHFFNRQLGRLRHRLEGQVRVSPLESMRIGRS